MLHNLLNCFCCLFDARIVVLKSFHKCRAQFSFFFFLSKSVVQCAFGQSSFGNAIDTLTRHIIVVFISFLRCCYFCFICAR